MKNNSLFIIVITLKELFNNSIMDEFKQELKECQLCHQILPMSSFYKRKDRNGEYNWLKSYCKTCDIKNKNKYQSENKEIYNEGKNKYKRKYYHNNKDNVRIIQKRYYYKKLSPDKQEKYKEKLQEKYPEWVEQICV